MQRRRNYSALRLFGRASSRPTSIWNNVWTTMSWEISKRLKLSLDSIYRQLTGLRRHSHCFIKIPMWLSWKTFQEERTRRRDNTWFRCLCDPTFAVCLPLGTGFNHSKRHVEWGWHWRWDWSRIEIREWRRHTIQNECIGRTWKQSKHSRQQKIYDGEQFFYRLQWLAIRTIIDPLKDWWDNVLLCHCY